MKTLKQAFLFFIGCALFSGCSPSQGFAPKKIEGSTISFYATKVAAEEDELYLRTNVVYYFKRGGIYENTIDGKIIDRGNYSYRAQSGNQEASIMFTYMDNNNNYIYAQNMIFETSTSGTWALTQTTDPNIKGAEKGSFKVLSQS